MIRAPIVVILGHVDHGKTTLLDRIRNSHVAEHEPGGITQSIGATQVTVNKKPITFIDTPGHEAFSLMRKSGAEVADVGILVVAATDGVKPQTVDALKVLQNVHIPFVVAINKIDLPDASIQRVTSQLAEQGCLLEGYGGDVPMIQVSALTGAHVTELLDLVLLVYELHERPSDPQAPLVAPVIESTLDRRRGPLVSVVVKNGSIRHGDFLAADSVTGNVRLLQNDRGQTVDAALPGQPVQILGFSSIVPIGTIVRSTDKRGKYVIPAPVKPLTNKVINPEIPRYIVKSDSEGSLAALLVSLPDEASVLKKAVGDVTESDVLLAETTDATIIGFRVSVPASVSSLAAAHSVRIITNNIIYRFDEDLASLIVPQREPPSVELGKASVIKRFEISGVPIAGCRIVSGKLSVHDHVSIICPSGSVHASVRSIKLGKVNTRSVSAGMECGIAFTSLSDTPLNFDSGCDIIVMSTRKI